MKRFIQCRLRNATEIYLANRGSDVGHYRKSIVLMIVLLSIVGLSGSGLFGQKTATIASQRVDVQVRLGKLYPPSATAAAGTVQIVFSNGTYLSALDFLVANSNGKVVAETASAGRMLHRQSLTVTLTPGDYRLQVVGHPSMNSTLKVTAK